MPRYLNLSALSGAERQFVLPLNKPLPRNHVLLKPSPHQHFLNLPAEAIPPNVRIQNFMSNDKQLWRGITRVEKFGGKKHKDDGKEWRLGQGRSARSRGGLLWALRER